MCGPRAWSSETDPGRILRLAESERRPHLLGDIDQIEALGKADPHFRDLLGGVWRNQIREDVWERVHGLVVEHW
jgi:hypothetical protein